jgi:hypothetical protein
VLKDYALLLSFEMDAALIVRAARAAQLMGDVYMNLHGVGQAVDVILVTLEQVERYRNRHCLIIARALREGKGIYHA